MKYEIGMIGLGVMGRNLALNMERNGYPVVSFDIDAEKRQEAERLFSGKKMHVVPSLEELCSALDTPRKIMLMVPAGHAVDLVINDLLPYLKPGDLVIDGGNSHFLDTQRRYQQLKNKGLLFIGTGVSGGEEGALYGPSLMPGGDPRAWPLIKDIFTSISAKTENNEPCAAWMGEGGAGHFVKMVHNGIEYGDMQLIGEVYAIMSHVLQMDSEAMSRVFKQWNEGRLKSYLIEITAHILARKDEETGRPMVDVILDTAGQKGTGKWTSQAALDLGVPTQTITEAVFARFLSALKEERVLASKQLKGPQAALNPSTNTVIEQLEQALYASKICTYAQGFQLLRSADQEYHWQLNFANIASIWRAGCIIRAQFLNRIKSSYEANHQLVNLMLDDYFKSALQETQKAWRQIITLAIQSGIPVPAMVSALSYFDAYRSERLPANLLQAQRDYFGAHTYERVDKPRGTFFHTQWV